MTTDKALAEYISAVVVILALRDALREAMKWNWESDDVPENVINLCWDALIKSEDIFPKIGEEG